MVRAITWAIWNGEAQSLADLKISVEDRSFYFGDGIYEVIRVYGGKEFLLAEHLERLANGLKKMSLVFNIENIVHLISQIIRLNEIDSGYVYLQVSRGSAPREHAFPAGIPCNYLLYAKPLPFDPHQNSRSKGVSVITVDDNRWKRRDIKTVNLLANCMAKQAAVKAGCDEAIQIESDQMVTEGSTSNIFIVQKGLLITAPKTNRILPGITRDFVIELAKNNSIEVMEREFTKDELLRADEVFMTSTTAEVLSIGVIDGKQLPMARPVTHALDTAFQREKLKLIAAKDSR